MSLSEGKINAFFMDPFRRSLRNRESGTSLLLSVVSVTFSEKENVYESRERAPLSPLTDDGRLDSLTVGRVEMNFCVEFGRSPGHRRLISLRNDHRDGFYVTEKRMTES